MKYTIRLHGCDDTTEFDMELSDNEKDTLARVAEKSKESSTCLCMPTMTVQKTEEKE